jgi:hypothetical protein
MFNLGGLNQRPPNKVRRTSQDRILSTLVAKLAKTFAPLSLMKVRRTQTDLNK